MCTKHIYAYNNSKLIFIPNKLGISYVNPFSPLLSIHYYVPTPIAKSNTPLITITCHINFDVSLPLLTYSTRTTSLLGIEDFFKSSQNMSSLPKSPICSFIPSWWTFIYWHVILICYCFYSSMATHSSEYHVFSISSYQYSWCSTCNRWICSFLSLHNNNHPP